MTFKIITRTVAYGDGRKFAQYTIHIIDRSRVAGIETGPDRQTESRADALKAARQRIAILRKHRLFAIYVTEKHIRDGEARNCHTCAISQALWHNQERMGFSKYEFLFRVSSYACFADADGIVLSRKYGEDVSSIPVEQLPEIALRGWKSDKIYSDDIPTWTMNWDDWAESRDMNLTEWREKHGYSDGERPSRPGPCSFVLDLDAFIPATKGKP